MHVDRARYASCDTRGVAPASAADDPCTVVSFQHDGDRLTLTLRHNARAGVHTAGHVWSAARELSQWLAARECGGLRCLELGAGLALPSFVAAKRGAARVLATDLVDGAVAHVGANAKANACRVEARTLDFTRRDESFLMTLGEGPWDLIVFSDCIYDGDTGAALPHALAELLSTQRHRDAVAIGAFPPAMRAGVEAFWEQVEHIGLHYHSLPKRAENASDPRAGTLYAFRVLPTTVLRDDWDQAAEHEATVVPLFEDCD